MALLRRGDLSVTEVCFAVGCSSRGTITTRFTELVGMPPTFPQHREAGPAVSGSIGTHIRVVEHRTRPLVRKVYSGLGTTAGLPLAEPGVPVFRAQVSARFQSAGVDGGHHFKRGGEEPSNLLGS
jgi:hypothetical protein